jgi:DNA modification methylase
MQIEKLKAADLRPAPYNPRKDLKPGDPEFEKLKISIVTYGYVEPVIVNKRTGYTVVGGHQRLKVLRHLGHTEVDCVIVDLDEKKEKALNIALNKISGEWDEGLLSALLKDLEQSGFDLELTGFDLAEVKDLFGSGSIENAHEDNFDEDGAASEISEPITRTGDIWLLGKHRLLCEDSTKPEEIAKLMDGKLADLVVTDPPHNVNYEDLVKHRTQSGQTSERKQNGIANDNLSDNEFYRFLLGFYKTAYANMKGGAPLYVFHSSKENVNFTLAMKEAGFKVAQVLTWVKNHFTLGRQDYQWQTENILYGWKEREGCPHYFIDDRTNASLFDYAATDFKKLTKAEAVALLEKTYSGVQTDCVRCDKPSKSPDHPTMKPLLLVAKLIYNSSREGDIILESFGGSGSTLIAAGQLNRVCYACELDARYCDVIVKRAKLNFPDGEIRLIRNGKEVPREAYAGLLE